MERVSSCREEKTTPSAKIFPVAFARSRSRHKELRPRKRAADARAAVRVFIAITQTVYARSRRFTHAMDTRFRAVRERQTACTGNPFKCLHAS